MSNSDRDKIALTAATITEVAREAGVGLSTVSRVVRQRGSVSEATREHVLNVIERLGYVPNRIAGTLASAGSKLVGVIVPSLTNNVFPDVLQGANLVLEASQYQSVIGVTEYDVEREEILIASLLSWRPAAIILGGLDHTPRAIEMLKKSGVRVAELLDIDGEGLDIVVGLSHRKAGQASAEYLLKRGYRRIGYVGHNIKSDFRAGKRHKAFRDTLARKRLPVVDEEITIAPSSIESGRDALQRLLARTPDLDAVYFSNDDMAAGGYFHCISNNISVPTQLALLGFNGIELARHTPQPISTIKMQRMKVGEIGARLILAGGPSETVDTGFEMIEGKTT